MSDETRTERRDPPVRGPGRRTLGWLLTALVVVAIALFAADPLVEKHPHFEVERWPGFYAVAGACSALLAVLVAALLRPVVERPEDYYDR